MLTPWNFRQPGWTCNVHFFPEKTYCVTQISSSVCLASLFAPHTPEIPTCGVLSISEHQEQIRPSEKKSRDDSPHPWLMFVLDVFLDFCGLRRDVMKCMRVLPFLGRSLGLHVGETMLGDTAVNCLPPQGKRANPECEPRNRPFPQRLDIMQLNNRWRRG